MVVDLNFEFSLGVFGVVGQFFCEVCIFVDVMDDCVSVVMESFSILLWWYDYLCFVVFEILSFDFEGWNCGIVICLFEEYVWMFVLGCFVEDCLDCYVIFVVY